MQLCTVRWVRTQLLFTTPYLIAVALLAFFAVVSTALALKAHQYMISTFCHCAHFISTSFNSGSLTPTSNWVCLPCTYHSHASHLTCNYWVQKQIQNRKLAAADNVSAGYIPRTSDSRNRPDYSTSTCSVINKWTASLTSNTDVASFRAGSYTCHCKDWITFRHRPRPSLIHYWTGPQSRELRIHWKKDATVKL